MNKRVKKSTVIQSIIFDQSKWTISDARKWLSDHRYKTPAVDSTADYHRFRQKPPFDFQKGTFRTINLGTGSTGIKAVIAVPRKSLEKNPGKKRVSRIPSMLADLADCLSIELERGGELRFPRSERYALCTTRGSSELWILARKGSKRVQADDERIEGLYERFTGFEADPVGKLVHIPDVQLKRLDRAMAIVYRSDKFGNVAKDYIHSFNTYPTVSVDRPTKPRVVALRGGRIRVTAEGIKG